MSTELNNAKWFKSTRSTANSQCVEVAFVDGEVAVRDSKNPDGPALRFGAEQWSSFLEGVARDEFERP